MEGNGSREQQSTFDEWAILEVMGKTRLGGRVRDQQVFGVNMVRIEIPKGEGFYTRFFHPQALFSLTLVGEKEARAVAAYNEAPPVSRWEMERKQIGAGGDDAIDADEDEDGEY
jgi:hypothetical protein